MKKIHFSLATLFAFLLLQTSCKEATDLCFKYSQGTTISTNAVAAPGDLTITKSVANGLPQALTDKGVNVDKVSSIKVEQITLTIPSTAGYTFADLSNAELKANGQSMGKLPATAAGLTATFDNPVSSDVKAIFLKSVNIDFIFTATFKKAVAASTLDVKIPLNTCYQVL